MKKLLLCLALVGVALAGCGEDGKKETTKDGKHAEHEEKTGRYEPVEKEVAFGDVLETTIRDTRHQVLGEAKIIIDHFRIEEDGSENEAINADYDVVLVDVFIENTGDDELTRYTLSSISFELYNENGAKINTKEAKGVEKANYQESDLRPGGKSEGTIAIMIPKGEQVKELIYYNRLLHGDADSFVFTIQK